MSSVALMMLGTAPRMVRASVTRIAARALSSFSIASRILKEVAGRNRWRNPRAPGEVLDFAAGVSAVCVVMVDPASWAPSPAQDFDWRLAFPRYRETALPNAVANGCASAQGSSETRVKRTHAVAVVGPVSSGSAGIPQKSPWTAERTSSSANSDGLRCP